MNITRVNEGRLLAHPYESDYAVLRRWLTANPGVSLNGIRSRHARNNLASGTLRSLSLGLASPDDDRMGRVLRIAPESYRRQCPQCAAQFFHTDLYQFPWLTRCPIHHCRFTQVCPNCQQPWPDPKDLRKRSCPVCGIPTLRQLRPHWESLDAAPIGEILTWLEDTGPHAELIQYPLARWEDPYRPWWSVVGRSEAAYAAFRSVLRPTLSPVRLKALHIRLGVMHTITTHCTEASGAFPPPGLVRTYPGTHSPDAVSQQLFFADDYQVMKTLLAWIRAQTDHVRVTIANYRHLPARHFIEGPDCCPYCLGLSLWFFHVAARRHGGYYSRHMDRYPFAELLGGIDLFALGDVRVIGADGRVLIPKHSFRRWFYRRGLEILFVEALTFAFRWRKQVMRMRGADDPDGPKPPALPRLFRSRYCDYSLNGRVLTLAYSDASPLEACKKPQFRQTRAQCSIYQAHLSNSQYPKCAFRHDLSARPFTLSDFQQLHEVFHTFCQKEFQD